MHLIKKKDISLYAVHVCFAFKITKLAEYVGYIFLGNRVFIIWFIKDLPYPNICDIQESQKNEIFLDQKYVFT